jgi:ADP-ribosylglycohydrolase
MRSTSPIIFQLQGGKEMAKVYDKIYGCIAASRIASAMAVATEGWQYEEIEERWGRLEDFPSQEQFDAVRAARIASWRSEEQLPKRQPMPTLWRPERRERRRRVVGMTEDGIERQKLLTTAIIDKNGRITAEDWAAVIRRDVDPETHFSDLFWIGDEYIYPMVQGGVPPAYAGIFFPWPGVHGFTRGAHPLGIINAGNPTEAARDAIEVGQLMYPRYGSGLWSAGSYCAAIAEAMKKDATIDSVIAAARANGGHSMDEWIGRVIDETAKFDDVYKLRNHLTEWFRGWAMCGEENVSVALAIFMVTKADPKASIIAGVNWGRDTDCIAAMAAGITGAFTGKGNTPQEWIDKVDAATKDYPGTVSHRTIEQASQGLYAALQANTQTLRKQIDSLEM